MGAKWTEIEPELKSKFGLKNFRGILFHPKLISERWDQFQLEWTGIDILLSILRDKIQVWLLVYGFHT